MLKSIKENFSKVTNKMKDGWAVAKSVVMTVICIVTAFPMSVYAASNSWINPINKFYTFFITILTAFGGIVLAYGLISFGKSFKTHEQAGELAAIGTIAFGAILLGADAIIIFLQS